MDYKSTKYRINVGKIKHFSIIVENLMQNESESLQGL